MALIPVIEPGQAVPFVDGSPMIFNRVWWLFWNNLAKSTHSAVIDGSTGVTQEDEPVEY